MIFPKQLFSLTKTFYICGSNNYWSNNCRQNDSRRNDSWQNDSQQNDSGQNDSRQNDAEPNRRDEQGVYFWTHNILVRPHSIQGDIPTKERKKNFLTSFSPKRTGTVRNLVRCNGTVGQRNRTQVVKCFT